MRDVRRAKLNYMIGHIYQFHLKKYKLAKKHYLYSIKQNPSHGQSLFEYAYLNDKRFKNYNNAKKYYIKHIELIENNPKNIITYDIDLKSPKLSLLYHAGTDSVDMSPNPSNTSNTFNFDDYDINQSNSMNNSMQFDLNDDSKNLSKASIVGLNALSLAPIHSDQEYHNINDNTSVPTPVSPSKSKSKSGGGYNKMFENEEENVEIEPGRTNEEIWAEQDEKEKQKNILSLMAIPEEENFDGDNSDHVKMNSTSKKLSILSY